MASMLLRRSISYPSFLEGILFYMSTGLILFGLTSLFVQSQWILPWGKFRRAMPNERFGAQLPAKWGWILMESPSVIVPVILCFFAPASGKELNIGLLILFLLHYIHRSFVYPLHAYSEKGSSASTMPVLICAAAFVFNLYNASLQSLSLLFISDFSKESRFFQAFKSVVSCIITPTPSYHLLRGFKCFWLPSLSNLSHEWSSAIRFCIGFILFMWGLSINFRSDRILVALKKKVSKSSKETAVPLAKTVDSNKSSKKSRTKEHADADSSNFPYQIPIGGWFELVSCANYWGEILEWVGFSILCGTYASFSFAVFTTIFLTKRGLQQHRWYHQQFALYPTARKAVIPRIL